MTLTSSVPRNVGRYTLFDVIASGGMASVHIGRLLGPVGFTRTVAIKRLHENFAADPEFVTMLLDEARLAARIRHPNVVPTLDIVAEGKEILIVMEYVAGESLLQLLKSSRSSKNPPPIPVIVDIMVGALNGLHAAHEAVDEQGQPLNIVHRDVSPHNILIGTDGSARVLDFGIAKAAGRMHQTRGAQVKGKIRYMPAEQMMGRSVTRSADIYSAAVVLWEALAGQRLLAAENDAQVMFRVIEGQFPPPSSVRRDVPAVLDEIVLKGMQKHPDDRYPTAKAMANALESAVQPVTRSAVSDWVLVTVGEQIGRREERVAAVERTTGSNEGGRQPEHSLVLPRKTLPGGSTREPSTLSRAGSVSRSVSPPSAGSRRASARMSRSVLVAGSGALLAGMALAWAFHGLTNRGTASGGSVAPVQSELQAAQPSLGAAPSALTTPSSSAGPSSAPLLDGQPRDRQVPLPTLATSSVAAPTKTSKRVVRAAPVSKTPRALDPSARIYKRE